MSTKPKKHSEAAQRDGAEQPRSAVVGGPTERQNFAPSEDGDSGPECSDEDADGGWLRLFIATSNWNVASGWSDSRRDNHEDEEAGVDDDEEYEL